MKGDAAEAGLRNGNGRIGRQEVPGPGSQAMLAGRGSEQSRLMHSTHPVKRLIVNADDFGLTHGINRAIAELHRAGVLTSATLMAHEKATEEAVEIALATPSLGVGCHVVLVDGVAGVTWGLSADNGRLPAAGDCRSDRFRCN